MTDSERDATELWYRASPRNVVVFAIIWLAPMLLILLFLKRAFHGSAALYLFIIPWALVGLTMVVRPNWITRVTRVWEKSLERVGESLEKRPPPGFP